MTREEFNAEWLRAHQACFPGLRTWLGKMDADDVDDIMEEWYRRLCNVQVADAIKATRAMHGDDNLRPRAYEHHPSAVARLAGQERRSRNAHASSYADGQHTVKCLTCRDDGRVTVWHPLAHAAASHRRKRDREDWEADPKPDTVAPPVFGERGTVSRCARACTCSAGQPYAGSYKVYDPKLELMFDPCDTDGVGKLHDFEAAKVAPQAWVPPTDEF